MDTERCTSQQLAQASSSAADYSRQIRAGKNGSDTGLAQFDYGFDTVGNLKSRADTFGVNEAFCYDALNRLTDYAQGSLADCHATGSRTVGYDEIGNITAKSDVGTYTYPTPGLGVVRPHAVTRIAGLVAGVPNPTFGYDANGNRTCEYPISCAGNGVLHITTTYTASNMVAQIAQGTLTVSFTYDPEHDRITQQLVDGSTDATTVYLNDPITGAMSEREGAGSGSVWRDYLVAEGRIVGQRLCTGAPPCDASGGSWSWFLADHLGSTAVVTDASGNAVTGGRLAYDPWGRQRNPDGSDDGACALPDTSPATRLFTGQERVPNLCLVNLNARLYDPTIARFLSADSLVPDPSDLQSFNRYTYVGNQPLSLTDPTGHMGYGSPTNNAQVTPLVSSWQSALINAPGYSCAGNCAMTGAEAWDYISSAAANMMAGGAAPAGVKLTFDGKNLKVTALASETELGNGGGSGLGGAGYDLAADTAAEIAAAHDSGAAKSDAVSRTSAGSYTRVAQAEEGPEAEPGETAREIEEALRPKSEVEPEPIWSYGRNTPQTYWPPREGFDGPTRTITLDRGEVIDRYGSPRGYYASPDGTPFFQRSLPEEVKQSLYTRYEVIRSISDVQYGKVSSWFGQLGGGMQYRMPRTMEQLEHEGYLRPIK